MVTVGILSDVISKKLKIKPEKQRGLELWTQYPNANKFTIPQFADGVLFIGILTEAPAFSYDIRYHDGSNDQKSKRLNKKLMVKKIGNWWIYYLNEYLDLMHISYGFEFDVPVFKYYVLFEFAQLKIKLPELSDPDYKFNYINIEKEEQKIILNSDQEKTINISTTQPILLGIHIPTIDGIDHIEIGYKIDDGNYLTIYDKDYLKYISKLINPLDDEYTISFTNGRLGYYPILVDRTYMKIYYTGIDEHQTIIYHTCSAIE